MIAWISIQILEGVNPNQIPSTAFHASHFALSFMLNIPGRPEIWHKIISFQFAEGEEICDTDNNYLVYVLVLMFPTVACLNNPYRISRFSLVVFWGKVLAFAQCSSNSSWSKRKVRLQLQSTDSNFHSIKTTSQIARSCFMKKEHSCQSVIRKYQRNKSGCPNDSLR